jgi:DNA polymerase I-like protein with 3'-5' exonuclease and polymerase domains
MVKHLVVDVETTIFQKGNPYADRNKLCVVGDYDGNGGLYYDIEYSGLPYGKALDDLSRRIANSDLIIAFNAKFDMAWLRRYGLSLKHSNIWDVQYAHFCITGQEKPYPSLNDVLAYYGLPLKKDVVKEEYWDKGIDTPDIPAPILEEYTLHDCISEYRAFDCQREHLKSHPKLKRLIWTGCKDLQVTQEMEWNGLKLDIAKAQELEERCVKEIADLDKRLFGLYPFPFINWNSGDHLSSILYGGVVKHTVREKYQRILKDGTVRDKEHDVEKKEGFPRIVEPLKGSELKKEGFWSTDESVLRKLKAYGNAKKIIEITLERSKIEKKIGTYFHGFPKLYKEMDWTNCLLHPTLNHCVARTGRLSSSKPNGQNMEEEMRKCIVSRFKK